MPKKATKKQTEAEPIPVPYKVSCGHQGCPWTARVDLAEEVGGWQPPTTEETFEQLDDLSIVQVEVSVPWAGQPLEDAYAQHYTQVHLSLGQPPIICWEKVA